MDDRPEPLLDCFAEHGVLEYLRSLAPNDVIAGDAETLAELGPIAADDTACRVAHVDEVPADAGEGPHPIVVWTRNDEVQRVERLRRRHPDSAVMGLVSDLLPRLAAGREPEAEAVRGAPGYVLLCTPRTGSYHLCALLAGLGFGSPDEHLDQGLCTAARRGALNLRAYLDALRGVAVAHGWFGTKLISHVLFAAFDSGFPAPDFLAWLQRHRLRVLHLVRDDTIAQAVSNYFARHTRVWSTIADEPQPPRPAYDFDAILADWRELRQQQQWLDEFTAHLPAPPLRIVYEDLDREPERVLREITAFLTDGGEPPLPFHMAPRTKKQRDELSAGYARHFAVDLRARGLDR